MKKLLLSTALVLVVYPAFAGTPSPTPPTDKWTTETTTSVEEQSVIVPGVNGFGLWEFRYVYYTNTTLGINPAGINPEPFKEQSPSIYQGSYVYTCVGTSSQCSIFNQPDEPPPPQ